MCICTYTYTSVYTNIFRSININQVKHISMVQSSACLPEASIGGVGSDGSGSTPGLGHGHPGALGSEGQCFSPDE